MLNVYKYRADSCVHTPAGTSDLIKSADNPHINVSHKIASTMEGVQLDHMTVPVLIDYNPFHSDLDFSTQSPDAADLQNGSENESDEDRILWKELWTNDLMHIKVSMSI